MLYLVVFGFNEHLSDTVSNLNIIRLTEVEIIAGLLKWIALCDSQSV